MTAQNRIIESIEMWTDRLTGPFLSVDEEDLAQLPLSASRCRAQAPGSLPLRPQIRTFECRAIAPREARNQVVLWAAEWLAGEAGRRSGDLPDAAFGAGWSKGEAIHRAWLADSLRRFKHSVTDDHKLRIRPPSQSSVRTFLSEALSAFDRDDIYISLGEAPTGPVIARAIRHDETIGWGAGIDEELAIDHALADALAKLSAVASSEFMFVAYPNPSAGRWTETLRRMSPRIHEHYALIDAGHLLPFINDRAHVVALVMKLVPHGGPVQ